MGFHVAENKEFIDTVWRNILQPSFKKLPFVIFWEHTKQEYPQLSEKPIKIFLPFRTTCLCLYEATFSSYTLSKTTYHNKSMAKAGIRTYIKADIYNICIR